MNNSRIIKVNDEIQRETAEIIRGELKDPRISKLVSVVRVETTRDLKFCKIHVSVFGSEEEQQSAFEGIKSASGYIRSQIAKRLNLRATPELIFILDDSIEHGIRMSRLIDEINKPIGD